MEFNAKYMTPMIALIATTIVVIIALFFPWLQEGVGYNAIDFLMHGDFKETLQAQGFGNLDLCLYTPVIICILMVIVSILVVLPSFGIEIDSKIIYGIAIAVGAIAIILLLVFSTNATSEAVEEMTWAKSTFGGLAGMGFVITFLASIVPIFVGTAGLMGAYEE